MAEKIIALVIDIVKHSDRHDVAIIFSRERGRIACLVPAAASRGRKSRAGMMIPLSIISAETRFVAGKELQSVSRISPIEIWGNLHSDPIKLTIGFFLREFLNRYLRDTPSDNQLWDYLSASLRVLDAMKHGVANFHISFLTGLLHFAGIQPDLSGYRRGIAFDMRAGRFTQFIPPHPDSIMPPESDFIPLLSRINMANLHKFKFSAEQRRALLARLLQYYSVHLPGFGNLKSPDILSEIFR